MIFCILIEIYTILLIVINIMKLFKINFSFILTDKLEFIIITCFIMNYIIIFVFNFDAIILSWRNQYHNFYLLYLVSTLIWLVLECICYLRNRNKDS